MKKSILLATFVFAATATAQTGSTTFSDRLHKVLSREAADRIVARVNDARSRQLPADALEKQALMLASKGAPATEIEKAIDARAAGMSRAKAALAAAGRRNASADEIEAGGDLIRRGVDGSRVSELAKSAPSGRSLAVPLYVIGSLMDRGLPSDSAIARVRARLAARASDAALTRRPQLTGRELGASKRPANVGGRPSSVPANSGRGKPSIPGSQGRGRRG